MESETKELRGRLLSWQLWAERQIELGLMDAEQMPKCFDRTKNSLKEILDDRAIGSHCSQCGAKFKEGEKKSTVNHIVYFHVDKCPYE